LEIKGDLKMIDKNTLVKVVNKYNGTVGYDVPDLGIHRNFYPGESKEVTFEELEKLSFAPGGMTILSEFLEVTDKDAIATLFGRQPEPEYHYTIQDIGQIMLKGTLDQFLDCLDFAPEAVKESIKDIAVELPLNDVAKRDAIKEKLGFDVTRAIEIKNTKYDGGGEEDAGYGRLTGRRATPVKTNTTVPVSTGRRYKPLNNK
jgi:hypothetical protein